MVGDAGLQALYERHGPHLLAYLRRRTGDLHEADDLLQATFFAAARQPEHLHRCVSPRAYLFGIARNLARNSRRRRRKVLELAMNIPAQATSPDPRVDWMREEIGHLPEVLRETLELRLREELSYEEIATVLEIPLGTVRSRLHNAIVRLRAAVAEQAVSE
jgi:RNA polymerase sigma-70 factor (ECF subfamily)